MLNYIKYIQAQHLEKKEKWHQAFSVYQSIAAESKNVPANIAYRLGFVAEKIKDWTAAKEWLVRAVQQQPEKAQWRYRLALALEKGQQYTAAIEMYREAIRLKPQSVQWMLRLAQLLDIGKNYDEAKSIYSDALKLQPDKALDLYLQGLSFEERENHSKAIECCRQAVTAQPRNAAWHFRLGQLLETSKKYTDAARSYEQALKLLPGQPRGLFHLARILERQKSYEQAIQIYREAVALEPGNAEYLFRLGRALEQDVCYSEAASAYREAVALEPNMMEYLFRLGRALEQAGSYPEAAETYGQVAQLEPGNSEYLFRWGRALEQNTDYNQAAAIYRQMLELDFKSAVCHFHLGEALAGAQQLTEAMDSYRQAIALRPKNAQWHARFAEIQESEQQYEQATESYRLALAVEPKNTQWLVQRARLLEENKKYAEAAKAYRQALAVEPGNVQWLSRLAHVLEDEGKYLDAAKTYQQLLVLEPDAALELYAAALAQEAVKKYADAQSLYRQALELEPRQAGWYLRLGKTLYLAGCAPEAEEPLRQAMALEPSNAKYVHELALAIRRQGRTWQEVETLQQALELDAGHAQWHFELGDVQDKMNCFAEAAQAFQEANRLKPGNAKWYFREGYAWERAGKARQAQAAYMAARTADKELKAKVLGIGVFHQQRGFWSQAAEAYAREAKAQPFNAELNYRLGLAQDRCYHWAQAASNYWNALVVEPNRPEWQYRLGFALERQGLWKKAAMAYEYAASTCTTHTPYWFYRLGYVLAQDSCHEQACIAFLRTRTQIHLEPQPKILGAMPQEQAALENDYLQALQTNLRAMQAQGTALRSNDQAAALYKLGNQAERLQMWEEAAQSYQAAADRSSSHNSLLYYRLGYVLMQMQRYQEAIAAFLETRIFKKAYGVGTEAYQKNEDLMRNLIYREYFDTLSIRSEVILYESSQGASIGCSPWSIFLYLSADPHYAKFTHVWVINDRKKIPLSLIERKDIVFVERDSDLYLRYLASAAYLINNNTFPPYYVRKLGQKYLNTWHGTPLKFLGRDMIDGFMEHRNAARNFLQATHIISPNPHTSKVLIEGYDIHGIYPGAIAETGYPRIDRSLRPKSVEKKALKKKLGINNDLPVVLYAPTWRGTLADGANFDVERLQKDIEALALLKCNFLFRGHHMLENILAEQTSEIQYVVPDDIDTNDLLSIVDILITDYSSVFFDFLPLNRPIVFYAYDMDQYSTERGLYFPMESMPGTLCFEIPEVMETVREILERIDTWQPDEKYREAQNAFCSNEDGNSTKRAVEFFLEGNMEHTLSFRKSMRKSILLYAGPLMPNGITSAILNLLKALDYGKYEVTMIIDAEDLKYIDRVDRMKSISKDVRLIARVGRQLHTVEQKWIIDNYYTTHEFPVEEREEIYRDAFIVEYQRIFSSAKFDVVLNFDGYNRFWASLCGLGTVADNKIIYLHNAMYGEWTSKYPYLAGMFQLYQFYDQLISVSKSVSIENQELIGQYFGVPKEKFDYCNNLVHANEIKEKALEPLAAEVEEKILECKGTLFVGCGRLSPEKGFEKLIDAFAKVVQEHPESRLFILGDGPLRETLQQEIALKGLKGSVKMLGYVDNPFPVISRASCFVFSSDYEGQGLVALEALILDRPVISTDVVGPRSILENGEGVLVENSSQALAEAMLSFIQQGAQESTFSYEKYAADAMSKFEKIIHH